MLVIPALLSLKPKVVQVADDSIVDLCESVASKLGDEVQIVQKTARKLILELKRVYDKYLPEILEKFRDIKIENMARDVLGYERVEEESSEEEEDEEPSSAGEDEVDQIVEKKPYQP